MCFPTDQREPQEKLTISFEDLEVRFELLTLGNDVHGKKTWATTGKNAVAKIVMHKFVRSNAYQD
jgi:hypothetical protein